MSEKDDVTSESSRCTTACAGVICCTGVCLTIPEGAVRQGGSGVEVFLAVLRDDTDRPRLAGLYSKLLCTAGLFLFIQLSAL